MIFNLIEQLSQCLRSFVDYSRIFHWLAQFQIMGWLCCCTSIRYTFIQQILKHSQLFLSKPEDYDQAPFGRTKPWKYTSKFISRFQVTATNHQMARNEGGRGPRRGRSSPFIHLVQNARTDALLNCIVYLNNGKV